MSPKPAPGAPNAVRGIVIVVAAGLLGLFLLARGGTTGLVSHDGSTPSGGHVTSTTGNVPTIAPAPTTVAPSATKAPADVSVAVFNATGGAVTNAAGDAKAKLTPLGYNQISIADAPQAEKASAVYYADGYQANAQAIAGALGFDPGSVKAAAGAPNSPGAGQGASVVVVIGTDTASGQG